MPLYGEMTDEKVTLVNFTEIILILLFLRVTRILEGNIPTELIHPTYVNI